MGRMKELYMEIIQQSEEIPSEITISDVIRMKEMEITSWQEYEREQNKTRLQYYQSENPGEVDKIQQANKIFQDFYDEAKREKESNKDQQ